MRYRLWSWVNWVCDTQTYETIWVGPPDFKRGIFMYDVNARCWVLFRRWFIVLGGVSPEREDAWRK